MMKVSELFFVIVIIIIIVVVVSIIIVVVIIIIVIINNNNIIIIIIVISSSSVSSSSSSSPSSTLSHLNSALSPLPLLFCSLTGVDADGKIPLVIQICQKLKHRQKNKASIRVDLYKVTFRDVKGVILSL